MVKKLNELFMDEYDERVDIINSVAAGIKFYLNFRKMYGFNYQIFNDMFIECIYVIENWVGKTSVGVRKNKKIKKAFQTFFLNFFELLLFFKNQSDISIENEIASKGLYQGKLYRYLGTSLNSRRKSKIIIKYNDIFVSWTKLDHIDYFESKLHSNFIIISCEIRDSFYGIDLCGLGIGREFEQEVVFPTIKKLMC